MKFSLSIISPSALMVRPMPSVTELAEKRSKVAIFLTVPPTERELPVLTTSFGLALELEAAQTP